MSGRGEVVVRVRKLAENTVAMEAARAASIANAARDAAELADRRTREHPLRRGAGRMNADQLIVAAGAGAALRESAAVAAKEAARARAAADEVARRLAQVSAERQAAERFLEAA
ncbi:MAG: hypothetical protein R2705_12780 [Ilumatobacteraceae bacterium]